MFPKRLSILGVGLLGGSIGLATRSAISSCKIAGYGHRKESLDKAIQIGAIDEAYDSPAEAVRDADLVILCTPEGTFEDLLKKIGSSLAQDVVVTDVGSTKASVVQLSDGNFPKRTQFVGSHPM